MTGILLVDKPGGWTSHDVVAKLRGVMGERRIGHSGTLDPMATGLLVVFLGRATRAVEFAEADEKTYLAELLLGVATDTQDSTGSVLSRSGEIPDRSALEKALERFRGEIEQIPPMYSAIKKDGKKLYELARKGLEVERRPRRIRIDALEALSGGADRYTLRIRCSKGTYVRTLCHDIGQALGCGACMSALRRTAAGAFSVEQAHTLPEILECADPKALLLPVDSLFAEKPACTVDEKHLRAVYNGGAFPAPELQEGEYRVYGPDGSFLLLGRAEQGRVYTVKSFFEPRTISGPGTI